MLTPKIPINEHQRLATLQSLNLLDSPPEERFDRIARIAKGAFNVPIALITLVDENRQWFKSRFGLATSQTGRGISFCGHAILGADLFVVENTQDDERFFDNPLVTGEPFIRFYCGYPLRASNGETIGTLCIIDTKARIFSESERSEFRHLGSLVEKELIGVRAITIDERSGVSNKEGLLELAQHTIKLCVKQESPISLAIIDLERRPSTSDQNALHATAEITQKFKSVLRDLDIFASIKEGQFILLLSNCEQDEVTMLVEVYLASVNEVLQSKGLDNVFSITTTSLKLSDRYDAALEQLAQF